MWNLIIQELLIWWYIVLPGIMVITCVLVIAHTNQKSQETNISIVDTRKYLQKVKENEIKEAISLLEKEGYSIIKGKENISIRKIMAEQGIF